MGESNFANFPFPNTLYTSPINFQWGMVAIISLKPSSLKASKGRREIGNTYLFLSFQSPSFLWRTRTLKGGGGGGKLFSDQWKLTNFTFLCFCGNSPLDISYHATWRETQYPLRVTNYFSIFQCFLCLLFLLLYLYLVRVAPKETTPLFLELYGKWLSRLIY